MKRKRTCQLPHLVRFTHYLSPFSKIALVFVRQEYQREHFLLSDYNLKRCELEVFPNNNLNYFAIKDYDIFESEEELCKYIKVV